MAQPQSTVELKAIFNLFEQNQSGEIDIKSVNNVISQLDGLTKKFQNEKEIDQQNSFKNLGQGSLSPNEQQQSQQQQQNQKSTSEIQAEGDCNSVLTDRLNEKHNELKVFPNKKSTINFNDFQQLFNECINNKELQDELLQNCFKSFDFTSSGSINSKKIKEIFEIFNDKTSLEEIQNVLKFVGCVEDKMTFDEFKEFFLKNI